MQIFEFLTAFLIALGGFSFIQWIFNRKYEKRQLKVLSEKMQIDNKNAQFDLFAKMNDYLEDKFMKFETQDKRHSEEHEKINKQIEEIIAVEKTLIEEMQGFRQQLLRLQVLQLIDHSPEMKDCIDKLYKEYKSRNGNSYLDVKYKAFKNVQNNILKKSKNQK